MPFDTIVEVICFFSILTLAKLTETCRKFVNGVNKYHPSAQNPHQMCSLWIDTTERDRNAKYGGHSYTTISNTKQLNQLLASNSPNFLTGLSQKIYVAVTHMSPEYFQVN